MLGELFRRQVEPQGIDALAAVVVVLIADVVGERVFQDIVALAAVDDIFAGAAVEQIVAVAAADPVVAARAVDLVIALEGLDDVGAGAAVDGLVVLGAGNFFAAGFDIVGRGRRRKRRMAIAEQAVSFRIVFRRIRYVRGEIENRIRTRDGDRAGRRGILCRNRDPARILQPVKAGRPIFTAEKVANGIGDLFRNRNSAIFAGFFSGLYTRIVHGRVLGGGFHGFLFTLFPGLFFYFGGRAGFFALRRRGFFANTGLFGFPDHGPFLYKWN